MSEIISPCISICKTDPLSGFCYGCARTNEEKKKWKDESTDENWKLINLKTIESRMSGWQLTTFKDSYRHKQIHGMSLFKKNQENKI